MKKTKKSIVYWDDILSFISILIGIICVSFGFYLMWKDLLAAFN